MLRIYSRLGKPTLAIAAFVGLLFLGNTAAQTQAQTLTPSESFVPASNAQASSVEAELADSLRRGGKLEAERRWSEAVSFYEDLRRSYPDQQVLAERVDTAKLHLDQARRFSDASYLNVIRTMSSDDAQGLYSEVLLKIDTHYVHQPAWERLMRRGNRSLCVALRNLPKDAAIAHPSKGDVNQFREKLDDLVSRSRMRDRHEVRQLVQQVTKIAVSKFKIPPALVILEYTCAALGGLDDYSAFLTPNQLTEVYSQIEGNFVGLGIELRASKGTLLIVHVISGSPAEEAHIVAGDRIVAVGSKATTKFDTDSAADLLQGPEGTLVELVVQPAGTSEKSARKQVVVRRAHVEIPSVEHVHLIDKDAGVAYLRLNSFQKTTSRDVNTALWKLHRDGMRSLIFDLRGNPGGLLTAAVELADKFVQQGTIVSTRGRSQHEDFTYPAHRNGTWRVPLVVLIDGDSASASEIFAGAIRDHQRGTIVGEQSYGKGSVQGIFPLGRNRAGLRLTTAKFYSPSGAAISNVGVSPDVLVRRVAKVSGDDYTRQAQPDTTDPVVAAALDAARNNLAKR